MFAIFSIIYLLKAAKTNNDIIDAYCSVNNAKMTDKLMVKLRTYMF